MAILHSASLTSIPEYFTVTSAAAPDTYRESGFIPSLGRVYFGTAPDGSPCLVTTVAEGDPRDQVDAYRSEVAAPQVSANTGYWITWESFLPVDFPYNAVPDFFNQGTYCIAQMHDSPDVGNPIVNLSNVVFFVNNAGHIIVKVPTLASFADKTSESNYDVYIGPKLKLGQWVKMAWLVKFTTDATGFIESYYDGVPVCKVWRQRTDYTNLLAPYLRLGVYDFHHLDGFGRMTQYVRNVVIRDGSDSAFSAMGMDRIAAAPKQIP
jgi:hypothetical protein